MSTPQPAEPLARPATPSLANSHEVLCEVERRLDLLQYAVDGWCAWPLVRFEASLRLTRLSRAPSPPSSRMARLRQAIAGTPALLKVRKARHLIKTYSSGLAERHGDRYTDVWFDDIITAAGSTYKIEALNNRNFAERSRLARIPRDMSSTTLDLVAAVMSRVTGDRTADSAAASLADALRNEEAFADLDESWYRVRFRNFVASKRACRMLLGRVRPSYVLVADPMEHALVAAAREMGIQVLELQHGVSDRTHAGYGWTDYAVPYRDRMPLPHRMLMYGAYWQHELLAGGFWAEDQVRVVGSPRIDRYRSATRSRPSDGPQLLFTTQGLDTERVIAFLVDTLRLLPPGLRVRLAIKMHPLYDADPQPYLTAFAPFGDAVTVVPGTEPPSTFDCFTRAHIHLSIASASHYDALGLGVPTVILPFESHEVALPLHEAGHAAFVRAPEDLAALITGWRDLSVPPDLSDYYFRSGAVDHVLAELALDAACSSTRSSS